MTLQGEGDHRLSNPVRAASCSQRLSRYRSSRSLAVLQPLTVGTSSIRLRRRRSQVILCRQPQLAPPQLPSSPVSPFITIMCHFALALPRSLILVLVLVGAPLERCSLILLNTILTLFSSRHLVIVHVPSLLTRAPTHFTRLFFVAIAMVDLMGRYGTFTRLLLCLMGAPSRLEH